jgi:hypothetical protein
MKTAFHTIIILLLSSFVNGQDSLKIENDFYIHLKNNQTLRGAVSIGSLNPENGFVIFNDSTQFAMDEITSFKTAHGSYFTIPAQQKFKAGKLVRQLKKGEISLYQLYAANMYYERNTHKKELWESANYISKGGDAITEISLNNVQAYIKDSPNSVKIIENYHTNDYLSKALYVTGLATIGYGVSEFFRTKEGKPLYISLPIGFFIFDQASSFSEKNKRNLIDAVLEYNQN